MLGMSNKKRFVQPDYRFVSSSVHATSAGIASSKDMNWAVANSSNCLLESKQLLLFVFDGNVTSRAAMQSQKAVSSYFTSKHILPVAFAEQIAPLSSTVILSFHE